MIMSVLWIHISFALILNIFSSLRQHVDCVILDDGGFLLLSNQDEYISLVSFICIAFLCFLAFSTHVVLSLLYSNCEEVTKRLYDSATLWEWSGKAPEGQPFSGKGDFFGCFFFIVEAVVRSPVCVRTDRSDTLAHYGLLCVSGWINWLQKHFMSVATGPLLVFIHPVIPLFAVDWRNPVFLLIHLVLQLVRPLRSFGSICASDVQSDLFITVTIHVLYYRILYIWTCCCCFSSLVNHLIAKATPLKFVRWLTWVYRAHTGAVKTFWFCFSCAAPLWRGGQKGLKRPFGADRTHLPSFCKPSCSWFSVCLHLCLLIQIGQFFGEVDPVLMINLVNTSLYSFNKTYDYQSVCDPEKDSKAAAGPRSVYVVSMCFSIYSILYPDLKKDPNRSAVFFNFLSFFSLPLQTCSVLAGGHRVLPGEGAVSVLCLYVCVCVRALEWEDFFTFFFFFFYWNAFVWKSITGEKCSYTTVPVCL